MTLGGEIRRLQSNQVAFPTGNFGFEPAQTALNGTGFAGGKAIPLPVTTGNAAASFLLGGVAGSRFDYPISQYYRWLQGGVFVQDDWRVLACT